jgi:hypothetical protein
MTTTPPMPLDIDSTQNVGEMDLEDLEAKWEQQYDSHVEGGDSNNNMDMFYGTEQSTAQEGEEENGGANHHYSSTPVDAY